MQEFPVARIWFTTNYPMSEATRLVRDGDYPRQHLWGSDDLLKLGHEVHVGPFAGERAGRHNSALGDIPEQVALARRARPGDVLYAGDEQTAKAFALAADRGIRPFHLLTVFHHVPASRVVARSVIRGPRIALCLSSRVRESLIDHGRSEESTVLAPWGPDLGFRGYRSTGADRIVSCGKTNRDVDVLLRALARVDYPARVYARMSRSSPPAVDIVDVSAGAERTQVGYLDSLQDLAAARIVAIPLRDPDRLSGLTELNDALALGKPIVMTRSPFIDVDIEAVGCGIWVNAGDTEGWVAALRSILENDERQSMMSRKARSFAEDHWNADVFGAAVAECVGLLS